MLKLITGQPGHGKTLFTIHDLKDEKTRPIYYRGINDLKLDWRELKDPQNWHEEVPDGAIVVLDEVQEVFGVRSPKQAVPPGVAALEKHRHRGIDLYFITQHPNFLDHHARRLVGEHIHYSRKWGGNRPAKYHDNQVFDPSDKWQLKSALKTNPKLPKDTFDLYHSAEVHTHKRTLPKKIWLIPILLLLIFGAFFFLYDMFSSKPAQVAEESGFDSFNPIPAQFSQSRNTKEYWVNAFTPALENLPFTAPFYAEIAKPTTVPTIAGCISNDDQCRCYTQQGTVTQTNRGFCEHVVRHGFFDPFQKKERRREQRRPAPVAPPSDTSAGQVVS